MTSKTHNHSNEASLDYLFLFRIVVGKIFTFRKPYFKGQLGDDVIGSFLDLMYFFIRDKSHGVNIYFKLLDKVIEK